MATRMQVLVLEDHAEAGGGSESMAVQLAERLHALGHYLALFYSRPGSLLPRYAEICESTHVPALAEIEWRRPFWSLANLIRVCRAVRRHQPDVIFCSARPLMQITALVQLFTGIPAVFHLGLPGIKGWRFQQWLRNQLAAGISPSAHNAETWREFGWRKERLFVIPNWVDAERFSTSHDRQADRERLQLPPRSVLFLGRVVPEKGIEFLMRAFAKLRTANANLVIAGRVEADYRRYLDRVSVELGIESSRLRWVGPTGEPEALLRAVDLVVVPSLCQESFGLTLLEAMSCGTVVLGTSVGVFAEILGSENRDLIIAENDVDQLAEKIDRWLMAPTEAAARGMSLQKRAEDVFGCEKSVQEYERVLSAAVAARTRHQTAPSYML